MARPPSLARSDSALCEAHVELRVWKKSAEGAWVLRGPRCVHARVRSPSLVSDFVAQVQRAGGFQRANQVELDVLGRKIVEQPSPLAEQDGPELDLDRV